MVFASISAVLVAAAPVAAGVHAPPPREVFPVPGKVDWGEADASFGATRWGHLHEGQDLFADAGTPIASVRDGSVVDRGDDGGRGNYVAIWNASTRATLLYLHMQRPSPIRLGESVAAGDRVGAVGCTGSCWGEHLHLEVRRGRRTTGEPLDPRPLLRRLAGRD